MKAKYLYLSKRYLSSLWDYCLWAFTPLCKMPVTRTFTTVLFLADIPRLEMIRYAKWVKKSDQLHIIAVVPATQLAKRFVDADFNRVIYFRNHWHLRRILNTLPVDIVHGFARTSRAIRIAMEEFKLPVIYSAKDQSASYYGLNPPYGYMKKDMVDEKYCLQHADAIAAESMEAAFACHLYQTGKNGRKRFMLPIGCDVDNFREHSAKPGDEIHIVYIGAVYNSSTDKGHYGAVQLHWLIKALNDQGLHLHIYPNLALPKEMYSDYVTMDSDIPFFHLHEPVVPEKLTDELNAYHYAILPFFSRDSARADSKRQYATSQKIFNFMEAGLPALVSKECRFQDWMYRRTGAGISISREDIFHLRKILEKVDYTAMVGALKHSREQLRTGTYIQHLIMIYHQIYNSRKEQQDATV